MKNVDDLEKALELFKKRCQQRAAEDYKAGLAGFMMNSSMQEWDFAERLRCVITQSAFLFREAEKQKQKEPKT